MQSLEDKLVSLFIASTFGTRACQAFAALVFRIIGYAIDTFYNAFVDAFTFIAACLKLSASFVDFTARGLFVTSSTIINAA